MRRAVSFLTGPFLLSPYVFGQPPEPGAFLRQVERHFSAWDLDHDGKLSFAEIDAACTDPSLTGEAGAAAATLRKDFELHDRTLAEYGAALAPSGKTGKAREKAFAANLQKLEGMDRRVFPSALPKGAQLAQGRLGDCFLLAGVGTMAQVQPERLQRLVEELPGGKTAVHLGNGDRVELPLPTDAEVLIGSTTRGDGVWGNVFEKAIGGVSFAPEKEGRVRLALRDHRRRRVAPHAAAKKDDK